MIQKNDISQIIHRCEWTCMQEIFFFYLRQLICRPITVIQYYNKLPDKYLASNWITSSMLINASYWCNSVATQLMHFRIIEFIGASINTSQEFSLVAHSHDILEKRATLFFLKHSLKRLRPRTTVSQDMQTRFPVELAFAKFLSKIKGNF